MTAFERAKGELQRLLVANSVCVGEFTLASGAKSDFYVDCRLTTLDPTGLRLVGEVGWELIERRASASGQKIDAIGGLTMGADPIAIAIALRSAESDHPVQAIVVRKSAKEHGRTKRIEGNFKKGASVVVVDDVVTTGGSTLQAIDAIESEGGKVAFVLVLVDREEGGVKNIQDRGHEVVSFFTRSDLVGTHARSAQPSDCATA